MTKQSLPPQIQRYDHGTHLEIIRSWRSPYAWFLLVFSALWWIVTTEVIQNTSMIEEISLIDRYLPLIFVIAGLLCSYSALAALFNRTYINAHPAKLVIKHAPLLWPGGKTLDATQIIEFSIRKINKHHNDGILTRYTLMANTRSGREIKLLSNLPHRRHAAFIKKQLEQYFQT
ncbi:MAG: hypothetical protein ABJN40_05110 [Sneathiella sp.]